jgi:hypothetical protein
MLGFSNWVNKIALLFYVSKLDYFLKERIDRFCQEV